MAPSTSTRVLGQLDAMSSFASRSAIRAEDITTFGIRAATALTAFNEATEASFQVHSAAAEALIGLGAALNDLDTYVSQIALALRNADTGTISQPIAAAAVEPRLDMITELERGANRATTALLKDNFDFLDTLSGGADNGKLSISNLQYLAKQTDNPELAAAAAWLLEHPMVLPNMDTEARTQWVGENGNLIKTAYPSEDYLIELNEILDYERRREAFYTLTDEFGAVDSGDALGRGANDGKISEGELHKMQMDATLLPDLRAAAGILRHNNNALNGFLFNNDDIAGRFDLDEVSKLYTDPRGPLPKRKTNLHKGICGAAGHFSYIGWLGIWPEGKPTPQDVAGDALSRRASRARDVYKVGKAVAYGTTAVATKGNAWISTPATGADVYCRVTDPDSKTWGKVKPIRVPQKGKKKRP
jgi:hypothetical protein